MQVLASASPALIENRRLHKLIVDGVPVEYLVREGAEDGTLRGDTVRLVDLADPDANDWLAVAQFTVIENGIKRRADVVLFVNGLPLAVFELKNAGDEQATLTGAFNQLQTYKAQVPALFRTNAVLVTSDGLGARIGSLTADEERFMPWRTVDGRTIAPKTVPQLPVLTAGVFERHQFLALIQDFIVFGHTGSGLIKIIAGYHQFHAVRRAVTATVRAIAPPDRRIGEDPEDYGRRGVKDYRRGDRRIGVIWHTQGSGKSLLMVFYVGQLVRRPELENPTIVVITDRNDLDDQLFGTFAMCADLLRQTPFQVQSREDLRQALNRASGGIIFTTLQKFSPAAGEDVYGLMQAIARVNRVFRDKPAGLVVDYIGIAQNLKEALRQYSTADQGQTGIDEAEAVAVLLEKFDVVVAMFHGFDYHQGLTGTPQHRLVVMAEAIDWILAHQHAAAEREQKDEDKQRAHRCYQDAVLALSKAFALAAASDEARAVRDAVGFFQTIRAALVKSGGSGRATGAGRDFAIAQIVDRAVVSTERL